MFTTNLYISRYNKVLIFTFPDNNLHKNKSIYFIPDTRNRTVETV